MSMQGKVVVITGSNTGIGLETAVGVAAQEATTVLACRNQAKAEAAAKEVVRRTWNEDVHVVPLDLADLASVRKAADEIIVALGPSRRPGQQRRWDVVQPPGHGAGLRVHDGRQPSRALLPDAPAAATPARPAPARIVNVTSVGHHFASKGMRFDDLQSEHGYDAMEAYCRAKLANVLFTRELARRLDAGVVTANAAHPGWVRSRFGMDGDLSGSWGSASA